MAYSFRHELPRIYELKDLVDPSHPDAYFQNFEETLEVRVASCAFRELEDRLAALDDAAWQDLKKRAAPLFTKRSAGRGWRELFDILRSETRAFGYLQSIGCTGVHFITTTGQKTPDLRASQDGRSVFCEVKTINISDEEAKRRIRGRGHYSVVSSRRQDVSGGFLQKLRCTLAAAVEQLDAADPQRQAVRVIFTMLHFDDWWGDHQARYIAQIDEHLMQHPVDEAELVFCLKPNIFGERPPTRMKSAKLCFE